MNRVLREFKVRRLSIRTRLLLLVLAGMVPAAGGFAWLIAHQREQAREAAYAQVRVVAKNMATEIDALLRDSEIMLAHLAARPSVRALDPRRCDPLFQEQIMLRRHSTVFGLRDAEGRLICISGSTSPLTVQQMREMTWFREGITNNRFTVSDAYLGRVSGRWVTNLTYPVRDDAGRVTGLVFAGIDLLKLKDQLAKDSAPSTRLAVFDRKFQFLLRSFEPEKWLGKPLPAPQRAAIKDDDESFNMSRDILGVSRLWINQRMPGIGWTISVGMPEDEVFAASRRDLQRSVAIGSGALLLMLALAWFISTPIRKLGRTSARLIAGDVAARAELEGPAEIEALAAHFNGLLDERERTLEDLRESRERFEKAFQATPDSITLVTLEGVFVEVNDSFERFTGYSREDAIGHNAGELNLWMDPAQRDYLYAELWAGRTVSGFEGLIRRKDGAMRIGVRFATLVEIGGAPHILSIMRDITEARRVEQALQHESDFAAHLVEAAPAIIITLDLEGRIRHLNPYFEKLSGYRLEEVRGKDWFATFLPERDRERIRILFVTASHDVPTLGNVNPIVTRSGEEREIEWHDQVVRDEQGKVAAVLAIGQDVTERRSAEEALRTSEQRLKEAQRIARLGNWDLDLISGRLVWSDEIYRIFEIDRTKFGATYEAFLDGIHPEDREAVNAAYTRSLATREPYDITHRLRMADGRIKYVHERCESVFDAGGKPLRSLGTVQDITTEKLAEEAVRASEERVRHTLDSILEGCMILGFDWRYLYVNEAAARHGRQQPERLLGRTILEMYPGVENSAIFAVYRRCMEDRVPQRLESEFTFADGVTNQYEFSVQPVSEGIFVLSLDITDRVRATEALRISTERLVQAQRIGKLGYLDWDLTTNEVVLSEETRVMYGLGMEKEVHALEEITSLLHPDDRERVAKSLQSALDGTAMHDLEHRMIRPDGTEIHVRATAELIRDGDGRPVRLLGTNLDITERKRAEERLLESLQEKETLLREIHHRVKNNLQIISGLLHFQSRKATNAEDLAVFQEGRQRLKAMILVHEKLYRSQNLSRIEFGDYARELVEQVGAAYRESAKGIALKVEAGAVYLPIEVALPLGMLLSELLTNVFKYAYPAGRSGELRVTVAGAEGKLHLVVADDGVGLPVGVDPGVPASFGMELVANLVEQLGGEVRYLRGAGLRVEVSVPLKALDGGNEQWVA